MFAVCKGLGKFTKIPCKLKAKDVYKYGHHFKGYCVKHVYLHEEYKVHKKIYNDEHDNINIYTDTRQMPNVSLRKSQIDSVVNIVTHHIATQIRTRRTIDSLNIHNEHKDGIFMFYKILDELSQQHNTESKFILLQKCIHGVLSCIETLELNNDTHKAFKVLRFYKEYEIAKGLVHLEDREYYDYFVNWFSNDIVEPIYTDIK